MSAWTGWFVSLIGVLGLVLALNHLGVNVSATLIDTMRSTEHLLGQPLWFL